MKINLNIYKFLRAFRQGLFQYNKPPPPLVFYNKCFLVIFITQIIFCKWLLNFPAFHRRFTCETHYLNLHPFCVLPEERELGSTQSECAIHRHILSVFLSTAADLNRGSFCPLLLDLPYNWNIKCIADYYSLQFSEVCSPLSWLSASCRHFLAISLNVSIYLNCGIYLFKRRLIAEPRGNVIRHSHYAQRTLTNILLEC